MARLCVVARLCLKGFVFQKNLIVRRRWPYPPLLVYWEMRLLGREDSTTKLLTLIRLDGVFGYG